MKYTKLEIGKCYDNTSSVDRKSSNNRGVTFIFNGWATESTKPTHLLNNIHEFKFAPCCHRGSEFHFSSPEDEHHLRECIRLNKYITFEESQKTFNQELQYEIY